MTEVVSFAAEKMKREGQQVREVIKQIQDRYRNVKDAVGLEFISAFKIKYEAMLAELDENDWDISKISVEQQEVLINLVAELVKYNTDRYGDKK